MAKTTSTDELADHNVGAWANGDYVRDYAIRTVGPAETVLLASYRGSLNGAVLEIGPGTGRLTRVLTSLRADVTALDVSPRMVEATRVNVPEAHAVVGDMRDLSAFADASFRAVVASNNVLDVLGDEGRRTVLGDLHRVLEPDGVLLFSSHNQANLPHQDTSLGAFARGALSSPRDFARTLYHSRRIAKRVRNRRSSKRFEHADGDFALVNDPVHDHALVMYFIGRDAQERQLTAAGFELVDCFDVDGRAVPADAPAERSTELHYAARRRTSAAN